MKLSFTKIMCVEAALFAIASSSMSLTLVGDDWAKPILFASISVAVWIGFPASVLAMLSKIHDDRGKQGMYSYLEEDARRSNDKYYAIYPTCITLLALAVVLCWTSYINGLLLNEGLNNSFAMSDRGRILDRLEVAELLIFCAGLCTISSTFMAYVLREKGLGLAKLSLAAATACVVLMLSLYTCEVLP